MRSISGQAARHTGRLLHASRRSRSPSLVVAVVAVGVLSWRLARGPLEMPWPGHASGRRRWAPTCRRICDSAAAALAWEGFRDGVDRPLDVRLTDVVARLTTRAIRSLRCRARTCRSRSAGCCSAASSRVPSKSTARGCAWSAQRMEPSALDLGGLAPGTGGSGPRRRRTVHRPACCVNLPALRRATRAASVRRAGANCDECASATRQPASSISSSVRRGRCRPSTRTCGDGHRAGWRGRPKRIWRRARRPSRSPPPRNSSSDGHRDAPRRPARARWCLPTLARDVPGRGRTGRARCARRAGGRGVDLDPDLRPLHLTIAATMAAGGRCMSARARCRCWRRR